MADFDVLVTRHEVLHLISKPYQWTYTLHSCRLEGSKIIQSNLTDSYDPPKMTILAHFGKTWVNPFDQNPNICWIHNFPSSAPFNLKMPFLALYG